MYQVEGLRIVMRAAGRWVRIDPESREVGHIKGASASDRRHRQSPIGSFDSSCLEKWQSCISFTDSELFLVVVAELQHGRLVTIRAANFPPRGLAGGI